jgi:hypothetical protein
MRKPKGTEVFGGSGHREVNDFLARKVCDDLQDSAAIGTKGASGGRHI